MNIQNEKENLSDTIIQLHSNREILSKLSFLKEKTNEKDLKINYQLKGNYVFVSSSRKSLEKIIKDYAFYCMGQNGNTYYAMRFPDSRETRTELRTLLSSYGIRVYTRFIVDSTPLEKNFYLRKKKQPPRLPELSSAGICPVSRR